MKRIKNPEIEEEPLTQEEQETFNRLNDVWGDDEDGVYQRQFEYYAMSNLKEEDRILVYSTERSLTHDDVVVYLTEDYNQSEVIKVETGLPKEEITKIVNNTFTKWYYYDIWVGGEPKPPKNSLRIR